MDLCAYVWEYVYGSLLLYRTTYRDLCLTISYPGKRAGGRAGGREEGREKGAGKARKGSL